MVQLQTNLACVGVQSYLSYIDGEARKRFEAGLPVRDAAHDIALNDFDSWIDAERIAVNVSTLYREYSGDPTPAEIPRPVCNDE